MKCNQCTKHYDREGLIRSLGGESSVIVGGFCSSFCYTQWNNKGKKKELHPLTEKLLRLEDQNTKLLEALKAQQQVLSKCLRALGEYKSTESINAHYIGMISLEETKALINDHESN